MPGNEVRSCCETAAKGARRTCALCRHFAPWRARVRANIERVGFDGAYRLGMPDGVCLAVSYEGDMGGAFAEVINDLEGLE